MEQTEITRILLSFVHSLFCKKHHPDSCTFYNDIELADCWDLPDVVCWQALTMLMMQKMNLDEKGLLDSIAKVHRCLEGLNVLSPMERVLYRAILQDADLTVILVNNSVQICNTLSLPEPDPRDEELELFFPH